MTKERLIECYKILEIPSNATMNDIKKAYREKSKMYHPDSDAETKDAKKFVSVASAYSDLKNNYDLVKDISMFDFIVSNVAVEKKLVYYVGSRRMPRHWDGFPIYEDIFLDVETCERFSLYSSNMWEEMVENGYECYSTDPDEYELIFHAIWKKFDKSSDCTSIRPISVPFEQVRNSYLEKIGQGKTKDIVAEELKAEYNEPKKENVQKVIS